MISLNRESLQLPTQVPDFINNAAIFNRAIERTLQQIDMRLRTIEFELFDVIVTLSGNINLLPPPFNNIVVEIVPDITPPDIIIQIQNILNMEFGVFVTAE